MLTRLLATAAVLGAAASIAGLSTYATFSSTTSVGQGAIATGSVAIALGTSGPANRLTVGASGLLPGETVQRAVDLSNSGSSDLASVTLSTSASASNALTTDTANGIQLAIDSCSQPWSESGAPPGYSYSCGGAQQTVLAQTPVLVSGQTLSNLVSLGAGQTDHLRVTLGFPSTAPNSMQSLSTRITYTFAATQRAGTGK